jgi:hypothetical protein
MKALTTAKGNFGPYDDIVVMGDRYSCNAGALDLPFSVVGQGTIVEASTITWPVPPVLAADRATLLARIDADTDAIYRAVQGDRAAEYLLAESDATAYKNAGYTGTVPSSVQSWANAKTQTAQWATDDILATATAWRNAQAAIRANRLALKEQGRVGTDLSAIENQWSAFVVTIRKMLGVPL